MAAASLQRHGLLHSPCIHISSTVSSTVQSVRLCSPHVKSLGLVVMRLPVRSWSLGAREEGDDGLALYEEELGFAEEEEVVVLANSNGAKVRRTFRLLGSKEKKELRAYAHQLGNDICMHQVGKWGLTANCITAISDALEANELVKIRVLDNLDEELGDTANQLEGKTGGQIVGKIGRTFLLYRPSMRKLKAAQEAEERAYKYQKRKTMLASRARQGEVCTHKHLVSRKQAADHFREFLEEEGDVFAVL